MKFIILLSILLWCPRIGYSQQIKSNDVIDFVYSNGNLEDFKKLAVSLNLKNKGDLIVGDNFKTTKYETSDSKTPTGTIYFYEENEERTVVYETFSRTGYNWLRFDLLELDIKNHFYVEHGNVERTYFTHTSRDAHLDGGFKLSVDLPKSSQTKDHNYKFIFTRPTGNKALLALSKEKSDKENTRQKPSNASQPKSENYPVTDYSSALKKPKPKQDPLPDLRYHGKITYTELYNLCKSSGNDIVGLANKYSFIYNESIDRYISIKAKNDKTLFSSSKGDDGSYVVMFSTTNGSHFSLILKDLKKIGYHPIRSLYKKTINEQNHVFQHSNDAFYLVYMQIHESKDEITYTMNITKYKEAFDIYH